MVNLQKSGNSAVKFVFTDSDHYLYGNGVVDVPVNSLLLVIDESDMVTFKKLSGDPFLSFRADNSNLGTKAAIEQFYKENMVGSTGGGSESGITPSEVQDMIDESISGKADTAVVNQAISEATQAILSVSGDVQSKADASALTAHADNANVHFSGTQKSNYDGLEAQYYVDDSWDIMPQTVFNDFTNDYSMAMGQFDQRISANTSAVTELKSTKLDASAYTPTDLSDYWTSAQTQSAIDGVNNVLTAHTANTTVHVSQTEKDIWNAKVDTSAITTSITSGSTDAEIPTAKAVYDATQSGGGGMDDDTQQLISTALNDLNDRKADLTELSKYQKKGDYVVTSTLAETLSDYMTNDAFDEYATAKERIISGALNDLNDKFGGIRLVKISQTDYDNLATKDENTLYIINNVI